MFILAHQLGGIENNQYNLELNFFVDYHLKYLKMFLKPNE
jgi:hypothetical protein